MYFAVLYLGLLGSIVPFIVAANPCGSLKLDGKLPGLVPSDFEFSGNVRSYYITAEQDVWDYAPTGWDNWLGVPFDVSPRAMAAGYTDAISRKWIKALYRGYSDLTFSKPSAQPNTGLPGPPLRAEVGDLVQILFYNKLQHNYASMHSMGFGYGKEYEGSLYPNNTMPNQESGFTLGDAVPPGECFVYKWVIPRSSSPPPTAKSRQWSYHSFVNSPVDIFTGLTGPAVTYHPGTMKEVMKTNREFFISYQIYDETMSFLSGENARMYGNMPNASLTAGYMGLSPHKNGNYSIWHPQLTNMPAIMLSSSKAPQWHSLNGYVLANNPQFEMCQDDSVIWYLMAYGSESHAFHMHGNNFQRGSTGLGEFFATQDLNDGVMETLFMNASLPGKWQLLCHVNDHLMNGMVDFYFIYPKKTCPSPLSDSS